MKKGLSFIVLTVAFFAFTGLSFAEEPGQYMQVAKAMNPCNPCSKNPCSKKSEFRKKGFMAEAEAVSSGEKLWNDPKLGKSGLSCNTCHKGGQSLHLDKVGPFPHFVKMPNDVVTLDQMINFCMLKPMKAKPLRWDSRELTALAAYYQQIVMEHKGGAVKNPCNPCVKKMMNPCNPCNPCAKKMKNACNPCAK